MNALDSAAGENVRMEAPGSTDVVVAMATRWQPSKLSTKPLLFQDEERAVLIFSAGREPLAGGIAATLRRGVGPSDVVAGRSTRIEIRFDGCLLAKFGYPGQGALSGHPLYDRGLNGYGLYEVLDSSWTRLLAEQDKISSPKESWPPFPVRHFVATFTDAIFECLCGSVRGRATNMSVAEILEQLIR
jgi:hypothetical protein